MDNAPSKKATEGPGRSLEPADRRSAPRYPFIADVELTDLRSGAQFKARTSELSLTGCYIDFLNMLSEGSLVRVRIVKDNGIFKTEGKVVYIQPSLGMGIAFFDASPEDRAVLDAWLAELGAYPVPPL